MYSLLNLSGLGVYVLEGYWLLTQFHSSIYTYSELFLYEFWHIISFKESVHFLKVIKFVCMELFIVLSVGSVVFFHFSFLILVISVPSTPYLFLWLGWSLINFIDLNKELVFSLVDFLYWFPVFNFVDFWSNSYYFFSSLGFNFLLFF